MYHVMAVTSMTKTNKQNQNKLVNFMENSINQITIFSWLDNLLSDSVFSVWE